MILHKMRISPASFLAAPAKERVLFVMLGHFVNEGGPVVDRPTQP
jgi:hypothetical protein